MTKFKLGQEVFIIFPNAKYEINKCLDCKGKRKEFVCQSCNGNKEFIFQTFSHFKTTIASVFIFNSYEEYTVEDHSSQIYSSNIYKTVERLKRNFSDFFIPYHFIEEIKFRSCMVTLLSELYKNEKAAIKKCETLKKLVLNII